MNRATQFSIFSHERALSRREREFGGPLIHQLSNFKSSEYSVADGANGAETVLGEILQPLRNQTVSGLAKYRNGQIPPRRKQLSQVPGTGSATILVKRHVPDIVQRVLNRPMTTHQRQQIFRRRLLHRKTGYPICQFFAPPAAFMTAAADAKHALDSRPAQIFPGQLHHLNATFLQAAMFLFRGCMPLDRQSPHRGKNRRPGPPLCFLSDLAGYPSP